MTNSAPSNKTTTAFYAQAVIAFGIALTVVTVGELYLPVAAWTRAFLALGTVFLVSATFTLAKVVRDHQESESVVSRLDHARVERLLAQYDPYRAGDGPRPESAQHEPPTVPAPWLAEPQPMPSPYGP